MFIPLHDTNSLRYIKLQYVTIGLIAANVVVWLATSLGGDRFAQAATVGLGYIPAVAFHIETLPADLKLVPAPATYVTYAFLHGGFWHIAGNMIFLWIFGDNVEDALGHFRYLVFYLLCAVAAALFYGMLAPSSEAPLIGASGAIAGTISAYLLLHPKVKIWVLAFGRIPLRIPAWIALAVWIGYQFVMVLVPSQNDVAWGAHVGGIIAGALLVLVMRRRGVPLFDREIVTPKAVTSQVPPPVAPAAPETPTPWGPR